MFSLLFHRIAAQCDLEERMRWDHLVLSYLKGMNQGGCFQVGDYAVNSLALIVLFHLTS